MIKDLFLVILLLQSAVASAEGDIWSLAVMDNWDHASEVRTTVLEDQNYVLGLGALQKIRGVWQHRHSVRLHGRLERVTWLIEPGYTAQEAMEHVQSMLRNDDQSIVEMLFECERLKCGSSAEWANSVFAERLLYGPDRNQAYAAIRVQNAGVEMRLAVYAVQRSNKRQYLHIDTLQVAPSP